MMSQSISWSAGISLAAAFLLAVPLLVTEADARPGAGGSGTARGAAPSAGRSSSAPRVGGSGIRSLGTPRIGGGSSAARSIGGIRSAGHFSATAKLSHSVGPSSRFAGSSPRPFTTAAALSHRAHFSRVSAAFGHKVITNPAFRSSFVRGPVFSGRFHGSHWPWWRGGIVIGWIGPVFWPYAYDDFFDYVFWPYVYDDFWPYAYEDIYYGIYGSYAYVDPGLNTARRRAPPENSERRVIGVCSEKAPELTDWPIERISQVIDPTDVQRAALDELKGSTTKALEILRADCPSDLPSVPSGRLAAMESWLQVMLEAVETVRPSLDRLYQSLSDEQKARFNSVVFTDTSAAAKKDQRDLTRLCAKPGSGIADLPTERIALAVHPTEAQQTSLDELRAASAKAAERLKGDCPTYQSLTPTGRVEAMEKRLEALLEAVRAVQPALTNFYDGLSDEQKARFNTLGSTRSGA
jgi:LTXXQ motif family protein